MQINISINYWQDSIKEIRKYLEYNNDLPSDFIEQLDLKSTDSEDLCYTEKFETLGEAVEFCLKMFPKIIVEYNPDLTYEITFYTSYVE